MSDFNDRIIAEFRANNGHVQTAGFGSNLVLLHTTGAKSGTPRISPLMGIAQPDGSWLVIASKGGAPEHPAWFHNLLAQPQAAVEVPTPSGIATVPVVATQVPEAEYAEAWHQATERSSAFQKYQERTGGRTIPLVRLVP